jgi:hypothetical protein
VCACAHYLAVMRAADDGQGATTISGWEKGRQMKVRRFGGKVWRGTNVLEGGITSAVLIASVVSRYAFCQRRGGKDDDGENDRGGETHVEIGGWQKVYCMKRLTPCSTGGRCLDVQVTSTECE